MGWYLVTTTWNTHRWSRRWYLLQVCASWGYWLYITQPSIRWCTACTYPPPLLAATRRTQLPASLLQFLLLLDGKQVPWGQIDCTESCDCTTSFHFATIDHTSVSNGLTLLITASVSNAACSRYHRNEWPCFSLNLFKSSKRSSNEIGNSLLSFWFRLFYRRRRTIPRVLKFKVKSNFTNYLWQRLYFYFHQHMGWWGNCPSAPWSQQLCCLEIAPPINKRR